MNSVKNSPAAGPPSESIRLERLRWRSRRGLLELELLLRPFNQHRLATLSEGLLAEYEILLDHDDMDVHEWLLGRTAVPAHVAQVVAEFQLFLNLNRF